MTEVAESPGTLTRYFLVMFQNGSRHDSFGALDRATLELVQRRLDQVIQTPPEQTVIDIWLESLGGDANAAYKLFLELRSRCKRLWTVIPNRANSAATLLSVGTDRIYMAAAAELGPLDVQIEHPDRENVVISALEVAHALDFLSEHAVKYIVEGGRDVFRSTDLSRATVLKEISRSASLFLKPVVAKLDPQLTRQALNDLKTAQRYARIMLTHRNVDKDDQVEGLNPSDLAHHLVRHYPSHDYVISRMEALSLGLPVRLMEDYDHEAAVRVIHRQYRSGELASAEGDTESLVEVFSEPGLGRVLERLVGVQADEDGSESHESPEGEVENPEQQNTQPGV